MQSLQGLLFGNIWLGTWLCGTPSVGVHVFLLGTHRAALAALQDLNVFSFLYKVKELSEVTVQIYGPIRDD